MELLLSVFSRLLSMSLTALPVMGAVLAVRWLLRRAPKRYGYYLWAVVGFRLACPVRFPRSWSVFNLRPLRTVAEAGGVVADWGASGGTTLGVAAPAFSVAVQPGPAGGTSAEAALSAGALALRIAAVVWLMGLAALLAYGLWSYLRLRRQVSTAVLRERNLYECDHPAAPFVLGFVRPVIYIPFGLDDSQRTYVLCHERYHVHRRDYLVKPLAYLLLAVYWWNPAVWLCYALCCRDMEMSCDEAVLDTLGMGAKAGYGRSLVDFAAVRRFPAASPLAFGEHDAQRRVKNVLRWKRASQPVVFLALCAVALVAVVCGSDAAADRGVWVRVEEGPMVSFTCNLSQPVQAWAIYADVYENGVLVYSEPWVSDGFADGGGSSSRHFSGQIDAEPEYLPEGGFGGTLHVAYTGDGTRVSGEFALPKDRYTGAGQFAGPEGGMARYPLQGDDGVVLLTVLLSTKPGGGTVPYHQGVGVIGANDTVVRFRLVTSTDPQGNFPAAALGKADALFALRTPYVGSAPAVGKLLSALGVGELGDYALELFTSAEPYTLQINFKEEPADIDPTSPSVDGAMLDNAALLLALVHNLEQVNWTYPSREDGVETLITVYGTRAQPDDWAQNLGYADIKALGQTPEGIDALLRVLSAG